MRYPTINELAIMVSIRNLGDKAYGVMIKKYISQLLHKDWNYGTLYCQLDQLVKKGFVQRVEGNPVPIRGGRRKIFYSLTKEGTQTLKTVRKLHMDLWQDATMQIAIGESQE